MVGVRSGNTVKGKFEHVAFGQTGEAQAAIEGPTRIVIDWSNPKAAASGRIILTRSQPAAAKAPSRRPRRR